MTFFTELKKAILKFIWNHRNPIIAKAILKKNNKAGGINSLDFRQHYKSTLIKTAWYSTKTDIEQQNREPGNKLTHDGLIFHKGSKNIQRGKDSLFSKWCWEGWTAACKSMKLECIPHIIHKRLKDLNIRYDTIKLQENIGKTFYGSCLVVQWLRIYLPMQGTHI